MASKKLKLESIRLDGDTQPRAQIDLDIVVEYADAYAAGVAMPPAVVFFDGVDHWLADGFHRWHGAKKAGLDKLDCEVRKGTLEDARWYSYAANQTHGLRRTNPDKQKAVKAALLHPNGVKMSDRQIAEHVGVGNNMVSRYRNELEATVTIAQSPTRTGRDGRTINTANIGKDTKKDRPAEQRAKELFGSDATAEQVTAVAEMLDEEDADDTDDEPIEVASTEDEDDEPAAAFSLPLALAKLENLIVSMIADWPEEHPKEAADLLERLARDLRNGA